MSCVIQCRSSNGLHKTRSEAARRVKVYKIVPREMQGGTVPLRIRLNLHGMQLRQHGAAMCICYNLNDLRMQWHKQISGHQIAKLSKYRITP